MNFVTKSVTTKFSSFFPLLFHGFKAVFLPLYIVEGEYIGGLLSPKHIQDIVFFIEKACFYSGDKSGDKINLFCEAISQ